MLDELSTAINPSILTWLIMIGAWTTERSVPISSSIDPIAFFRFVCKRMGDKVLPFSDQSQQHYISGTFALLTLIVPTLVIVYLIASVASYTWLFDGIVLYVCLQFSREQQKLYRVQSAVQSNKKQLARDYLQSSVLRDTGKLSTLGICKASIEMYLLRLQYQQVTVLFCFALAGPIGALSYRLSYEASQVWNVKLVKFKFFGAFSYLICRILQFVPVRIFGLVINIMNRQTEIQRVFTPLYFFGENGRYILFAAATALQKTLDGPVFYDGHKVRRKRSQMPFDVDMSDVTSCTSLCTKSMLIYLVLILMTIWLLYI